MAVVGVSQALGVLGVLGYRYHPAFRSTSWGIMSFAEIQVPKLVPYPHSHHNVKDKCLDIRRRYRHIHHIFCFDDPYDRTLGYIYTHTVSFYTYTVGYHGFSFRLRFLFIVFHHLHPSFTLFRLSHTISTPCNHIHALAYTSHVLFRLYLS